MICRLGDIQHHYEKLKCAMLYEESKFRFIEFNNIKHVTHDDPNYNIIIDEKRYMIPFNVNVFFSDDANELIEYMIKRHTETGVINGLKNAIDNRDSYKSSLELKLMRFKLDVPLESIPIYLSHPKISIYPNAKLYLFDYYIDDVKIVTVSEVTDDMIMFSNHSPISYNHISKLAGSHEDAIKAYIISLYNDYVTKIRSVVCYERSYKNYLINLDYLINLKNDKKSN